MESPVDHPRPSADTDEPAAKHFKPLSSAPFKDDSTSPDAPAMAISVVANSLLDYDKECCERGDGLKLGVASDSSKENFEAKAPGRYKTSLCSYFRKKGCKHETTCRYAHGEQELQPKPDGSWDPTSERAKRLETEKEMIARMEMVNDTANNVEEGNGQDGFAVIRSDLVRKCINNLPWTWNTNDLKNFLDNKNLQYSHAKKKKGMNLGFIGFEDVNQWLLAIKTLEGVSVHRKVLEVADVHPRVWEKEGTTDRESQNALPLHGNASARRQTPHELPTGRVRDICDVVTPLSRIPYYEQLVLKKSALAQVLKRLARNTRKICAADVLLPDWILAARELEGLPCELEDIIPSPNIDGYRNKCEFSIGCSSDGKRVVGFQLGSFREGITTVAEPSSCQNVSRIAQAFASAMQKFVEESELPVWNKHNNTGFWRMLTVREGRGRRDLAGASSSDIREVMLIVQVCPVGILNEKLSQEYKNIAKYLSLMASRAEPVLPLTVLLVQEHIGMSNAAPSDCPLTCLQVSDPAVEDGDEGMVAEKPVVHIHDQILDLSFQISPTAFFQVNTLAAEKLYSLAGEWACLGPETLLFDVCCGTGTIGLTLAHRVGLVVGIEMNASAVVDAWTNAKINGIQNCEFVCAKAEDVFKDLLDKYAVMSSAAESSPPAETGVMNDYESGEPHKRPTMTRQFKNVVVIVDPPRSGLHPMVLKTLRLHAQLRRIVYISCNPETLMANAVELCTPSGTSDKGNVQASKSGRNGRGKTSLSHARGRVKSMPDSKPFKPVKAVGVDMFPHTNHCEVVMLFER